MKKGFKRDKTYFQAIAVMVGYIIGVGMFSLPYIVSKAGIYVFFVYLIGLGLIQYLIHLIYANVVVATHSFHRLPGYVGKYLGRKGKTAVFISQLISNFGGLLAYIIISGIFLHQLFGPYFGGSELIYGSLLFFIEAFIVFFGIKMIAKAELFMTSLLILVICIIVWKGHSVVNVDNYINLDWKYIFLPYGAMLFAMGGGGSLPMIAKMLKKDKQAVKSVMRLSMLTSFIIIAVFTLTIVGISGGATTPDALVGISGILGEGVIKIALIFGVLTMVTSFFGVAEAIKETFWWDYGFNKNAAWAVAVFIPYLLYLAGMKSIIDVVSFAGGVAGGFSAAMLMLVFLKLKKQKTLFGKDKLVLFKYKPANFIIYFLIGLFMLGVGYEIYHFLIG